MSTTTPNVSSSVQATPGPVNGTPKAPLIRAVSSKNFTKSAPALAPAADTYEPLVKALFRHRLQASLFHSAIYAYIVINLWTLWQAGGFAGVGFWGALWIPINPWTLSMTLLAWTSMAVPVTVLRKALLTRTDPLSLLILSLILKFPISSTISGIESAKYSDICTFTKEYQSCCGCTFYLCFLHPTTSRLERILVLS